MRSLIVVDANIAFRLLCAGAEGIRDRLRPGSGNRFFAPQYIYIELLKHKDRLLKSSHLREADLLEALQALLSRLEFVGEANIPVGTWIKAYQLCREVDENDTP